MLQLHSASGTDSELVHYIRSVNQLMLDCREIQTDKADGNVQMCRFLEWFEGSLLVGSNSMVNKVHSKLDEVANLDSFERRTCRNFWIMQAQGPTGLSLLSYLSLFWLISQLLQ